MHLAAVGPPVRFDQGGAITLEAGRRPLSPKTVLEIHLIIRADQAVKKGLISRNVALVTNAPKLRIVSRAQYPAFDYTTSAIPTGLFSSRKECRSRWSVNDSGTPTLPSRSRPTSTYYPACRPKPPISSRA